MTEAAKPQGKIDIDVKFAGYGSTVKIDGVPVPYVRSVRLEQYSRGSAARYS